MASTETKQDGLSHYHDCGHTDQTHDQRSAPQPTSLQQNSAAKLQGP
jgi:hypothetical protein